MNAARCVAVAVFRESIRDKVFYNLVLFALLLVGASILIGQLTAGQDVKIIKDLGLAATSIFGVFIAIFVGISLVAKEVERRSIYPLLAKPVRRPEFIVGKYLGLLLTLLVNTLVMTIALYVILFFLARGVPDPIQRAWDAPALDPALLKAFALIYLNLAVITAVAHEITYKGTVSSVEVGKFMKLQVSVVDAKSKKTTVMDFEAVDTTVFYRGTVRVKFADVMIQKGEAITVIVDHDVDETLAQTIRLAAKKK